MPRLQRTCRICGTVARSDEDRNCEVDLEDSWSFRCLLHGKEADHRGCEDCTYRFNGEKYFELRALGDALSRDWEEAISRTAKKSLSAWLAEMGEDEELISRMRETETDGSLDQEMRLATSVMLLCGDGKPRWQGGIIDYHWLRQHREEGRRLMESGFPEKLADSGVDSRLADIAAAWKRLKQENEDEGIPEDELFGVLVGQPGRCGVESALGMSLLIPRMESLGDWGSKNGMVASMAAGLEGVNPQKSNRSLLKDLFRKIGMEIRGGVKPLIDGESLGLSAQLLSWTLDGVPLLQHELFSQAFFEAIEANGAEGIIATMAMQYFREFQPGNNGQALAIAGIIRKSIDAGYGGEAAKWRELDKAFHLFRGEESPSLCAKAIPSIASPDECVTRLGMEGDSRWRGFSWEVLIGWMRSHPRFGLTEWKGAVAWLSHARPDSPEKRAEWVEAAVSGWVGAPAPAGICKVISSYLVEQFGEPDADGEVWTACSAAVREVVQQWLVFENMEKFFSLIQGYAEKSGGEMRGQWGYRRAFWLAVYRTGLVSDIRVAAGRGFLASEGEKNLQKMFGSRLARLDDSDERRCALILRVGDLTIVDFTHSAKCRIWQTRKSQENWFKSDRLGRGAFNDRKDLTIISHYAEPGISHFNSESYGWQDATARFLAENASVKISRKDYELFSPLT